MACIETSLRDDLILYTITSDATLRIYLPILDTPQHVQLHASLDLFQAVPLSEASQQASSKVFWLDRGVVCGGLTAVLGDKTVHSEDGRHRRVQEILEEGWDLFLRILADGSLVLQAVAVSSSTDCTIIYTKQSIEYRPASPNSLEAVHTTPICPGYTSTQSTASLCSPFACNIQFNTVDFSTHLLIRLRSTPIF